MAESDVVTALIGKRAELAGLIEHHRKEMGRLADNLAHLDATLKLFSPEIDLRTRCCIFAGLLERRWPPSRLPR